MRTSVVPPTFRARARSAAEPVARIFGKAGLSPNALTVIGFAIAVVGAVLAAAQLWLAAGLVVAFGAVFDMFDGALARATNRTTKLGAFLDSTFDRAGEAVVYLGIAWGLSVRDIEGHAIGGQIWPLAAMAASFMVSYVRAKSESLGFTPGTGMANIGLAPREVRLVILVAGLVLTGLIGTGFGSAIAAGTEWLFGSLALITLMATITAIQRIYFVYRQSKSQEVTD